MIPVGIKSTIINAAVVLFLPCLLPAPGQAEDTAAKLPAEWENMGPVVGGKVITEESSKKVYQESRHRFNQKTHIKIDYQIVLSPGRREALKKYNPDFQAWKSEDYLPSLIQLYEFKSYHRKDYFAYQTPSALIGDFNGDAAPDVVMMGHDSKNSLTIALMSGGSGYRVVELGKGSLKNPKEEWYGMYGGDEGREYGLSSYLSLYQPSKIKANPSFNRPEIDLKTDAFIIEMFEKSAIIFVYKDAQFVSYTMGD